MFEMPRPNSRPVLDERLRLEAAHAGEPRLAARVRRVHVPVEHQARPAAVAREGAEHVRRARPRPAATAPAAPARANVLAPSARPSPARRR